MASAELDRVMRYLDQHRPNERTLPNIRRYLDAMVAMEPTAADVAVETLALDGVRAERLATPGSDASRTLLYFHGGGYSFGSALGYRPFAARLARAFGGPTFVLDYRLAPDHPFPAGIADAVAATRALMTRPDVGKSLVLGGDSAGGGLALATLLSLRDAGDALPRAAALLSPWVDLEGTGESITSRAPLDPIVSREGMQNLAQLYLGDRDRRHPLASPTYAKLAGLPPLLVHLGTREMQFDDVVAFADKARTSGVEVELEIWEEMIHVFQLFPVLSDAQRAIDRIGSFLRAKVT